MNELALVEKIAKMAGSPRGLVLGIGDDCAVFRPRPGEDLLFTTDQSIEGVHFPSNAPPGAIGERALARSLSDIAAMGGTPRFCLVSLALPSSKTGRWVESFYRGLLKLARRTRTPLAGGDFARDDKVRCDVTVCGAVKHGKALRRDSARPADLLYVSGRLGKFWDRPIRPRLDLGRKLIGKATACIDLSDGISLDLHRLCKASGVAAEIERIPVAKGASLERALHGGEDYELLFTCPDGTPPPGGTYRIGRITAGVPGKVQFEGRRLLASGYDHFSHSDF